MRQRRETLPHRFYMLFLCDTFFCATRSVVACRASVLPQSRETQARAEVASIGEAVPSPARDLRFSARRAPLSRIGRACCLKGKRRAVAASRARGRGSLKRRTTMERACLRLILCPVCLRTGSIYDSQDSIFTKVVVSEGQLI